MGWNDSSREPNEPHVLVSISRSQSVFGHCPSANMFSTMCGIIMRCSHDPQHIQMHSIEIEIEIEMGVWRMELSNSRRAVAAQKTLTNQV